MRVATPYECYLQVRSGGKGVPYAGGQRADGSHNHGFRSLKGRTANVAHIPEAAEDTGLARFLVALNAAETSFFTVGCVGGSLADESGHRVSGYVEFSFNDRQLIGDAVNYFVVFWHFTQALEKSGFAERVTLNWELLSAAFLDADCGGMTCSVLIDTHYFTNDAEARACWDKTLDVLGQFLAAWKSATTSPIY